MKGKEIEIFILVIFVLLVMLIVFNFFIYKSIPKGEWTCIAQKCVKWLEGDEWVAHYCKVNENKTGMVCKITINDKVYEIPLSRLDINNVKSCAQNECVVGVFVKEYTEVKK